MRSSVEPLRTQPADRDARIEQLLLAGLDLYFAGKYEQAINVWTRVAFLERGHGRARAYIERARGALAERQREAEELVHTGIAAYHEGNLEDARELLTRAVEQGGGSDTALLFLDRLRRAGYVGAAAAGTDPGSTPRAAAGTALASPPTNWFLTAAASGAVAAAILLGALPAASRLAELPVRSTSIEPAPAREPLPVLRTAEVRIARARELQAAGRLRDALRLLQQVDIADPLRGEADRLTADVQRALLAALPPPAEVAR